MKDNLVFIPSLGIVTLTDYISFPVILAYSAKNVYTLVRDSDSIYNSKEMYVKRTIEIDSKAIITLDHPKMSINSSVEELVEYYKKVDSRPLLGISTNKKKKGEDEEENNFELFETLVHEIVVERTVLDQDPISIQQSKPFTALASRSEKNEESLMTNLAKLSKTVALRSESLQHLRSPTTENVESSIDDLLPDVVDTPDVAAIQKAGLSNYEDKLRQEVRDKEDRINQLYDWFDEKVVQRYNSKASTVSGVITEPEVKIADVSISRQDLLDALFKDEIIFLNNKLSGKK